MLLVAAAEIRAILTVATTAATMPATAAMHSVAILTAVALIITVAGILLRLSAAGDESRQAPKVLSAFVAALTAALTGLLVGLLLVMLLMMMLLLVMLRPVVRLLIARRERLSVAADMAAVAVRAAYSSARSGP